MVWLGAYLVVFALPDSMHAQWNSMSSMALSLFVCSAQGPQTNKSSPIEDIEFQWTCMGCGRVKTTTCAIYHIIREQKHSENISMLEYYRKTKYKENNKHTQVPNNQSLGHYGPDAQLPGHSVRIFGLFVVLFFRLSLCFFGLISKHPKSMEKSKTQKFATLRARCAAAWP